MAKLVVVLLMKLNITKECLLVHLHNQVDKINKSPCSVREHKIQGKTHPKISN